MEESVKRPSSIDIVDYLQKLCDYALSIGMPYDLYWYGDPQALKNFVNAEEIRQRKRNAEMWIQGAYVYHAIGSLTPVLNPFSKESRAKPYMKQPIPITEKEQEEQRLAKISKFIERMNKKAKKEEV